VVQDTVGLCKHHLKLILTIIVTIKGLDFMRDDTVRTASVIKHQTNAAYPNITVCYPRFFDKIKMKGKQSGSFVINLLQLIY
jgi:low temperature requirement protein LtrA